MAGRLELDERDDQYGGGASVRTVAAVLAVLDTAREYGYMVTRTTMAKLLFFADLESVKQGGDPLSGLEWAQEEMVVELQSMVAERTAATAKLLGDG